MAIIREETKQLDDLNTGESILERKVTTITKAKTERYTMLFMKDVVPYLSRFGDSATVFAALANCMDENNIADVSASKKKAIVINNIYNAEGEKVDANDTKIKNQAARRFAQLATQLVKNNLIEKIDSCQYRINPFLLAYGYNKQKGVDEMRKDYLEATTVVDLKTGKTNLKIKAYYEGDKPPQNDGFDITPEKG